MLAGGISHERDVSLRSGRRVADSLLEHGIEVELRDPDASLLGYLRDNRPDVVWPALHGASGEDGALRGLLEFLGIPFVGSRSEAARLAWDKPTAKALVARAGVATPRSITLPRDAFRELGADAVFDAIHDELPLPLVVKPAQGGSAQGVTIVEDAAGLPRAMVDAYTYSDVAIIEQRIIGTEIAVGVIDTGEGPSPSPPSRSSRCPASTASRRATTPARRGSTPLPGSRTRSPRAPRKPRSPPTRSACATSPASTSSRRRGHPVVPRGERAARAHRDLARAPGARGGRHDLGWVYAKLAEAAVATRAASRRSARPAGPGCGSGRRHWRTRS